MKSQLKAAHWLISQKQRRVVLRYSGGGGGGGGMRAHFCVACRSHLTVDHKFLSRRKEHYLRQERHLQHVDAHHTFPVCYNTNVLLALSPSRFAFVANLSVSSIDVALSSPQSFLSGETISPEELKELLIDTTRSLNIFNFSILT